MFRFIFPVFVLAACNDSKDDTADAGAEDPGQHACEHTGVAGTAVTASASMDGAPEIALSEEPYTVTLVDGAAGYLAFSVDEATGALLFLGTADVADTLYLDGTEVGLPTPSPNEYCGDDIPEHFHLELDQAGTWALALGPAVVAEVWLMLMSAEGHEHHE